MKTYNVNLKVVLDVSTEIKAEDLSSALLQAESRFYDENAIDEGIVKLGKKFYRTYMEESVAVTGVSEV